MFGENRRVWSWALYDWANSVFATTIMTAILPAYYSKVAASGLPSHLASSYWGYTNTIAMLVIALGAPILGAIADYRTAKKKFLAAFAGLGILGTAFLFTIQSGEWLYASLFYIIGRIGFSNANIFYDSLLPHIAPPERRDRISSLGFAVGYLGGGLLLALNILMVSFPAWFGIADSGLAARYCFLTAAVWWAFFSLPLFFTVSEPPAISGVIAGINPVVAGFRQLKITIRHIRKYRHAGRFLLAFWLYNDGIGTIIVMAVIFGAELGIAESSLLGAILLVQFVGIPFTLLFGYLSNKVGTKKTIYLGLFIYTIISIGAYFMQAGIHFWILAFAVAMVQGGTQALSRSLYSNLIPSEKSAEFFGFYDVSNKFSGILGPAIFGLVSQLTGSSRLSVVSLIIFFIGGGLMLMTVDVEEGRKSAAGDIEAT